MSISKYEDMPIQYIHDVSIQAEVLSKRLAKDIKEEISNAANRYDIDKERLRELVLRKIKE